MNLHGVIYALGGFDGHVRLNTVERFDSKTSQWSFVQPMLNQRSDAKATVLGGKTFSRLNKSRVKIIHLFYE